MESELTELGSARLHVEGIGGIDEASVTFEPGITILAGRNATNRTSLLQALVAACGGDHVSVKGDVEEGRATLEADDESYTRTVRRNDDVMVSDGDPYLDDSTAAELFAFLLESNEARRAVTRGDDLREIIMRPVDIEEIEQAIEERLEEKRRVQDELEELDGLEARLTELERRRSTLLDEIEATQEEFASAESNLEAADADLDRTREQKSDLDAKFDELQETREELATVRRAISSERSSVEALKADLEELESEKEELPEEPAGELAEIESRLDSVQSDLQSLDSKINELQSLIQFNEEMLEGGESDVLPSELSAEGAVTDELLGDGPVVCWTCGSEVSRDQIEGTVEALRQFRKEKLDERTALQDELETLREERREVEERKDRQRSVVQQLDRTKSELEDRKNRLDELEDRQGALEEEIEGLERAVEELEDDSYSELLSLHRRANQLEFELDERRNELEDVEAEMDEIETRLAERDPLDARREELEEELAELRTRVEDIEREAIEAFNEHMEVVLSVLDYENLERIWLERTERKFREGRRKISRTVFDLHVVRAMESGSAYEDTVDHLSESEREVTGLVFALAGYLVHEVYDDLPFMLLDSVEAIDAERISSLVDYFSDYADFLIVALLEEDAAALDDEYDRVTNI